MGMDVILRVAGSSSADRTAEFAAQVEEAGFFGIGIPDTQLIMRDVYVTLAMVSQRTSHLALYTAVTNPVTRHVSVLASLVQTLEELAPGRVGIICGSGYSAVTTIGLPPSTLAHTRETVVNLRRLLSGDTVSFGGFEARLPFASGRRIPILIAATGPRTIELAGEVADGALINVGLHPAAMDEAMRLLEKGARKAGRDPQSLEVIYVSRVTVDQDKEAAQAMARPICVQWVTEPYRARWLRLAGIEVPDIELPPEVLRLYPDIIHAEDWEKARRLTDFLSDSVVAKVCDTIGLFGPPDHIVRRLSELEHQGVKRLILQTTESYDFPESTLRAFRDEVFPRMRP